MSFNFYAYLAGLVDAEGCLMITKKRIYPITSQKERYAPTITIGMTDREPLELITKHWPKNIWVSPRPPNKTMYVLRYQTNLTKEILEKIYPFLRVKREQADVIWEIIKLKNHYQQTGISNKTQQLKLVEKITKLKDKNVYHYDTLPEVAPFNNLEDEYSYFAGLVDGDGHIGSYESKVKRPDRNNKIYTRRWYKLAVKMNQPEGLIVFAKLFNSQIKKDITNNHKQFSLQMSGENLQKALIVLIPHLQLKREKAQDLLQKCIQLRQTKQIPKLHTSFPISKK